MHSTYLQLLFPAAIPLVVSLTACADVERADNAPNTKDCGRVSQCPITDTACQKSVLAVTACVRGDERPELPPIRTLTRDELRDELNGTAADPESALTADLDQVLVALHLMAAQSNLRQAAVDEDVSSVAAFYRDDQQDVTVIADTTMDQVDAMTELSHEFTHYLQDRAGQLKAVDSRRDTVDELLAGNALVESEAVVNSNRALAQMIGISVSSEQWSDVFDDLAGRVASVTNQSDSPFVTALDSLPYTLGLRTIENRWEDQGRSAVDALFDQPYTTALDWFNATGQSITEPLDCYPPLPPDGFELVGADTFGLLGGYALLGALHRASLAFAPRWVQDKFAMYRSQGDAPKVLAVWRIRFDHEFAATDFAKSIEPLGLAVTRFGNELAISVSGDPDHAPLASDVLEECPSQDDFAAALPHQSNLHPAARLLSLSAM